jgi:nucleotide-binding universal stress UspA family protein
MTATSDTEALEAIKGAIVVGVDGSEASKSALRWGARQAELTGSSLVAVTSWHYPAGYGDSMAWAENVDFEADAEQILGETIEEVLGAEGGTKVTREIAEGHPAVTLERASEVASLVVVGSRGHGEFAGMLLGSVSEHLATHARCPIVIVHGTDQSAD